tara:strand:+ start:7720 stop:8130 length:411 start_codon:yes stop_codon:yes gene_type:complete
MAKSTDHQTSAGRYDGGLPVVQRVGKTAWATGAVDDLGGFVAPCDLTLVQLDLRVNVAATSAAALFNLGTSDTADSAVINYTLENIAAGHYQVAMSNAAVITRTVLAGQYVKGQFEAATAVGSMSFTAVWMPTSVQ